MGTKEVKFIATFTCWKRVSQAYDGEPNLTTKIFDGATPLEDVVRWWHNYPTDLGKGNLTISIAE